MLKHTTNRSLEGQSQFTQVAVTSNQLTAQKYLQCPFSIFWSQLSGLYEVEGLSN